MSIAGLLKPIKVGLRSKLFICTVTILAAYSYCCTGSAFLKLASISVFFVSAEVMVWQWGNFFARSIVEGVKMHFGARKTVSWIEVPAFKELAKQMGIKLHSKRPFGIRKGFDNAYASHITRQVVFGEELLQRLGSQERLALAAHEFTHLKQNHWFKLFLLSLTVLMLVSWSLSLVGAPAIVMNLTCVAALVITFVFVSWRNEYAADAGASAYAGEDATVSLLKGLRPPDQQRRESETHPSVHDRISKLQRM